MQLGHNRLKVLDLSERSDQPFWSQDGSLAIVYNGEIYNYRELAKRHSIPLRTTSDTELLVELFQRLGPAMLAELNGMFAFAIFHRATGNLFLARDRLGIKPLYWRRTGDELAAASEIGALVELDPKVTWDEFALRQYRKLRTTFNGRTVYREIEMFPPGCWYQDGVVHRYWSMPEGGQQPPADEELRALIESAVHMRCLSDVPLGSYLSGGLDSTIVAGLTDRPHTWTVGFSDHNEFEWARLAAHHLGRQHTEVLCSYADFPDLTRQMIVERREPLSVPNEVLINEMTRRVKERNTVVLSGEGADELFFGYDRIFRWAASGVWDFRRFDQLYSYGSHTDDAVVEDALSTVMAVEDPLTRVAHFFQTSHLHGLLRRLDASTMLNAVEARVPFVDHRLIERMADVAFDYRVQGGVAKAPLKRLFADIVPDSIIRREKVGFPVPLNRIALDRRGDRSDMDGWLAFNLATLTGGAWDDDAVRTAFERGD